MFERGSLVELSFRDYAKPRFELRDGQLVLTHVPVPRPRVILAAPIASAPLPTSYLVTLVQGHLSRVWRKTRFSRPRYLRLLPHVLDKIRAEVDRQGAALLLAVIPSGFGAGASTERVALAWARRHGVAMVNISELMRGMSEEKQAGMYLARGDGHYSAHGYRIIAGELARVIRAERLLPAVSPH